jgi:hypothetical protein
VNTGRASDKVAHRNLAETGSKTLSTTFHTAQRPSLLDEASPRFDPDSETHVLCRLAWTLIIRGARLFKVRTQELLAMNEVPRFRRSVNETLRPN